MPEIIHRTTHYPNIGPLRRKGINRSPIDI